MKLFKRILFYIALSICYWIIFIGITTVQNVFSNIFVAVVVSYFIFNYLVSFIFIKNKVTFRIIAATVLSAVSITLSCLMIFLNLFPISIDPYGVTSIVSYNAIFSIICWEIIYTLRSKSFITR